MSDEDTFKRTKKIQTCSIWHSLILILWKNYKIRRRHWFTTICEIIIPVILFVLLAYARTKFNIQQQQKDSTIVESKNSQYILEQHFQVGITKVFYYPDNYFTSELLNKVRFKLWMHNDDMRGFNDEAQLMKAFNDIAANTTAPSVMAVMINVDDYDSNIPDKYPQHLKYTIRSFENGVDWQTNHFFKPQIENYKPGTGSEHYFDYGFIALQMAVDLSYIEIVSNTENLNVNLELQEFPFPKHTDYSATVVVFKIVLPLVTMFSFMLLCPAVLKRIVEEKSTGIKQLMKLMGMKSWMLWVGWFIHAVPIGFISVIAIVCLLKLPLFGENVIPIEHTHFMILSMFLLLYFCASVCFLFFISTLFTKSSLAMYLGMLIWVATFLVAYVFDVDSPNCAMPMKLLSFIFPNTALEYGFNVISMYENREIGIQWNNLFKSALRNDNVKVEWKSTCKDISMGAVLCTFIADIFIFSIFTGILGKLNHGSYGIPKLPLKILKKALESILRKDKKLHEQHLLKKDNFAKTNGIRIRNLKKSFQNTMAINGLNMDIDEGEITVLLGHNGAGKTTTMQILTGMLPLTSGSVTINELDINDALDSVQKTFGLCTQHNLLFSDLTVKEQLIFFGRLRGQSSKIANEESTALLKKLDLWKKRNKYPDILSGGMKRKLALGLALVGDPSVLMLDEPTSGLDPESRRLVWDILLEIRKSKTILITTHFMEEAEILGDKIAIMQNGTLLDCDTAMNLKNKSGIGYRINVVLNDGITEKKIKYFETKIDKIFPEYTLEKSNKLSLDYSLDKGSINISSKIAQLEKLQEEGILSGFGIFPPSLEDVFLKTAPPITCKEQQPNGSVNEDIERLENYLTERGIFTSCFRNIYELFKKKIKSFNKSTLIQLFVPVIIAMLSSMLIGMIFIEQRDNAPLPLNLCQLYNEPKFVECINPTHVSESFTKDKDDARIPGCSRDTIITTKDNLIDVLFKHAEENVEYFKYQLIAAEDVIDRSGNTFKAMYSNFALHGAPISLNLITNTILRNKINHTNSDYSISVTNHPLKPTNSYVADTINEDDTLKIKMIWLFIFPLGFLFLSSSFQSFAKLESMSRIKTLQFLAGVNPVSYWLTSYLVDLTLFISAVFASIGFMLVLDLLYNMRIFLSWDAIIAISVILLFYGISSIPFAYFFSQFKVSNSTGIAVLLISNLLIGSVGVSVVYVLKLTNDHDMVVIAENITHVLNLVPYFAFSYAALNFSWKSIENHNWNIQPDAIKILNCEYDDSPCCSNDEQRCNTYQSYYDGNHPIREQLVFLLVDAAVYFIIICILDSTLHKKFFAMVSRLSPQFKCKSAKEDNGATENGNSLHREVPHLIANGLKKKYSTFGNCCAVNNVSFSVKHGECFGLLGANGAGKSTTFKMLTTEENVSDGEISIDKTSIRDMNEYLKKTGYCPQVDALNGRLTAWDLVKFFGTLRGIPSSAIDHEVSTVIEQLGLSDYKDIECGCYSGGNKRKLNIAIALIGNPDVVFLDEPSTGVDPISKRRLWNVLTYMKNKQNGSSFVLTSHSMEECEHLCDRLTIMVGGELRCVGNLVQLKQQNRNGFMVQLQRKRTEDGHSASMEVLRSTLYDTFHGTIKDEHGASLQYQIPQFKPKNPSIDTEETPWKISEIYNCLENIKRANNTFIENYSVSDTTLEELFLSYAKNNHESNEHENTEKRISQDSGVGFLDSGCNNAFVNGNEKVFNKEKYYNAYKKPIFQGIGVGIIDGGSNNVFVHGGEKVFNKVKECSTYKREISQDSGTGSIDSYINKVFVNNRKNNAKTDVSSSDFEGMKHLLGTPQS